MILKRSTQIFLGLMAIAFCKVGMEALLDPQAVLAQVGIILDNSSATSSMRAVYGGMHLMFGLYCVYGIFKDLRSPLVLVALYTLGFIVGRISGIVVDGTPNAFVVTWLLTEAVSFVIALTLLAKGKN
ncbi:hypothetical protein BH09BAC3_BH09BAC3_28940 [soil metagenome]